MSDRFYESSSAITWYQCDECKRMWSLTKDSPPPIEPPDYDHSPDS